MKQLTPKTVGKQGRTKGATSFLRVKLSDLNQALRPDQPIWINRRQANWLNVKGEAIAATTENIRASLVGDSVKVVDLNQEESKD